MRSRAFVLWCVLALPTQVLAQPLAPRPPIVVQGAMVSETERFVSRLEQPRLEQVGSWNYWIGTFDGYPVIVSRTNKGTANAAAATMLAIERYRPLAIINQGTSGGHDPALKVFDIVIGTEAVNIGAFKTPHRSAGGGSTPLEWQPPDLTRDGSAGSVNAAQTLARFAADSQLLASARQVRASYERGRVVDGVIGSSDMWIDEVDLVNHMHAAYGTSVEEMETAAAAQVSVQLKVPFLGIRILSDNITNGGVYDPTTGEACEDFVYGVVRAHIASLK